MGRNLVDSTWQVHYTDGTRMAEYASDGTENRFDAIEWPKVTKVVFQSDRARREFNFIGPEFDHTVAMMSRGSGVLMGGKRKQVRAMMLVTFQNGMPLNKNIVATYQAACVNALYWLPDGKVHQCTNYDCPLVSTYLGALRDGKETTKLVMEH